MDQEVELAVRPRGRMSALPGSVAEVLRLIGNDGGGPVLMALAAGPLRTQRLAERLGHLSARSVYRHVSNLKETGLVARREEPGVPSRVLLSLTDPAGRELSRLLRRFVSSAMSRFPERGVGTEPWAALPLLADLWELSLIDELSHGPRSVTEMARKAHPMSYHQVNRRASLFATSGLAASFNANGNGKCYELTDQGRRCMGLLAGIGRWRQRHILDDGSPGLSIEEMATVLRVALPLIRLPQFAGMRIDFEVSESANGNGYRDYEVLKGHVDPDGRLLFDLEPRTAAEGSAAATVNTWFGVLLEGNRGRVKVGGYLPLVDACLTQVHAALWEGSGS